MSKSLTTFEALKANETKRVRGAHAPKDDCDWFGVGELIIALNRGAYSLSVRKWKAEEPMIEKCVVVNDEGQVISSSDYDALAARLAECEAALEFYAGRENWFETYEYDGDGNEAILYAIDFADQDTCGGKRAREYFEKYQPAP